MGDGIDVVRNHLAQPAHLLGVPTEKPEKAQGGVSTAAARSSAHRIVRNPLADSASSTRRPRRAAGFEADAGREAGASAVAASEASPAAGAGGSCAAAASGTPASGAPASAGDGALPWRSVRCRSAAGLDGWLARCAAGLADQSAGLGLLAGWRAA